MAWLVEERGGKVSAPAGSHSHEVIDPGLCGFWGEPQGGAGPAARVD